MRTVIRRRDTAPLVVVDLDGTLLRSDILWETFWSALGRNPLRSTMALLSGRAALKRHLAQASRLDETSLPYDPDVIAYIRAWRDKGGRTALVTASDQSIADRVAAHLGLFDEVHGSDGRLNLKGKAKAAFLVDRFGSHGFAYIGDARADVPVWAQSSKVITVNASQSLKDRAEGLGKPVEHLATTTRSIRPLIKALRPNQWLKNALVFLPMLAAHQLDSQTVLRSFMAFVAFCLVASSVYVLNDLLDLGSDRAHPRKRLRPFASGSTPIAHGNWMASLTVLAGLSISALLGWQFLLVMLGYYVLTAAYSLYLKRRIVIDICVLAGLYTIRIVAGGVATGITLSVWLLAFSIFFFFSLAAVKRQAELVDMAERGQLNASGRGYHVNDVGIMSMIALGSGYVSVLVMALYINSPAVLKLYDHPTALWGICCVLLYWITRTVMIAHRGSMHYDPVVYAAKDWISWICFVLILGFALGGAVL